MTEEEARDWVAGAFGLAAVDRLARYAALLVAGATTQNLIAPSTIPSVWSRHIADSAQLARLAEPGDGLWLDIGSGAGLPGLVLALLLDRPFVLSEPRRLRAVFLREAVAELGLEERVEVVVTRVEQLRRRAATISARAVMGLDPLLRAALPCADPDTQWILPRGQSGRSEIELSSMLAHATFHVEHSLTDPLAAILVARGIA